MIGFAAAINLAALGGARRSPACTQTPAPAR
jgi:hypothetical protein